MNAFSAAVGAIFADANVAADGVYVDGFGVSREVRVMRRRPDPVTDWGGVEWVGDADLVEILVSDAPDLMEGRLLFVGGETLRVLAAPRSDPDRLVWTVQVEATCC